MKKVILISAKAQHGKDTFADMVKQKLESKGERVLILHFAQYIKMYCKMMGWDGVTKDDYWRSKLQKLGTEKIRQELKMPNFHVQRVCEDIQILSDEYDYFLIPDARFPNEIYYTKAIFPDSTFDLRIIREGFTSTLSHEQKLHPSEIGLDSFMFSYHIYNTTIDELKCEVDYFVEDILEGKW